MPPLRPKTFLEDNPVGIPREVAFELTGELDAHLASLFLLFHQYQKHHWLVEGPQFHDIHVLLGGSYEAVHKEVDQIAERITALGAIPVAHPGELIRAAYISHEEEGFFPLRAMLTADMRAERMIAIRLRETIRKAFELGDYGTRNLLEKILLEVEDRAHHLSHLLAEDSLEDGRK